MIRVKHLTVSVGDKTIIRDFSFDFETDKVYVVMGPNGSGKSTLAYALMNHPSYEYGENTQISLDGDDITELEVEKRAQAGMFLSFQTPMALSGVTVYQLMQMAKAGKADPLAIRKSIQQNAKDLNIHEELLSRSLNEGASGGEKKKLEVLQAAVLDHQVQIYDEIDTGVDVDALRAIGSFLHKNKKGKTYIIITHYNRILEYIKPDEVLVLVDGSLVAQGGHELVHEIEKTGYETFRSKAPKKKKN